MEVIEERLAELVRKYPHLCIACNNVTAEEWKVTVGVVRLRQYVECHSTVERRRLFPEA